MGDGLYLILAEYDSGHRYYGRYGIFHFVFYAGQFSGNGKGFGEGCSVEKI